MKMCQENKGFI